MNSKSFPEEPLPSIKELNKILAPYQKADIRRGILQLINTVIPYFILWYLMIRSLEVSYVLTLAIGVLASLFLVRLFIFFHDCGHNSFFPSTRANKIVGFWLGVLVFTPGEQWWHSHIIHHATAGNLDKRGVGDVTTMTQEEYIEATWFKRLGYKFYRNPFVMFGLGPLFMFFVSHRIPVPYFGKKETWSVIWNNLAILAVAAVMSYFIGIKAYLMIQIPVMYMAGVVGIWLFYIQHQFEEDYWERDPDWNFVASALLGSSFYKLPGFLQWFTGNIGYHHIHHLNPKIANYNLEKAHYSDALFQKWAHRINFRQGYQAVRLKVWDGIVRRMHGFPTYHAHS